MQAHQNLKLSLENPKQECLELYCSTQVILKLRPVASAYACLTDWHIGKLVRERTEERVGPYDLDAHHGCYHLS
jgi:hypothetical protein